MRTTVMLLFTLVATPAFSQDWVAGIEATSTTSYTYVTHYTRSHPMLYWQTASYLRYSVREGTLDTEIHSPGISTGAMYRWESGATSGGFGAGYEMRWTDRRPAGRPATTERQQGPLVEGDVSRRFTGRTSGRLAARWSAANDWRAASAELRHQVRPSLRIGPQFVYQGNDEVSVLSAGALIEIPRGSGALQFRAGAARVSQGEGERRTQPYFSAGLVFGF